LESVLGKNHREVFSLMHLYEIANYLNMLSDKADKIRALDRDRFKHYSDIQILEEIIDDRITELENEGKEESK
jgi:hypothetical protein